MDSKDLSRPVQRSASIAAATGEQARVDDLERLQRARPLGRLRNADLFVGANVFLFLVMCAEVYYGRYTTRHVVANVYEFAFYAVVILAAITVAWRYLRMVAFPAWVLLLVQAGILAHFAGGFVAVHGQRLYDVEVVGLTFDKYVHALNAFAGAALVSRLIEPPRAHPHLGGLFVLLIVQGGGALVEIAEYLAKLNVPGAGVGDYDNNMQDLIANCAGALLFLAGVFVMHGLGPVRAGISGRLSRRRPSSAASTP